MTRRASDAARAKSSGAGFVYSSEHGDARVPVERAFDGRRDRAGIEDVDPRVGAGVQSADDQIRRLWQQFLQGQFDAIGRPAFDRPAHGLAVLVEHFLHHERHEQRDRMPGRALLRWPARRRSRRRASAVPSAVPASPGA